MLTGENGILNRASKAKEDTDDTSDLEYLQIEATSVLIDYYQGNDNKSEYDYILDKWSNGSNKKISVNKTDQTITYNGKIYTMSDIIGNESEKKKIAQNNMKQITISNAENNEDKELLSGGKVRIIIEEENGMQALIPNGFYYVTGKPSNGLVISDIYGDNDNNTKGGNQFVWIPCSSDKNATDATDNGTTVTYEKVNGLAETWKEKYAKTNGKNLQYCYTEIPSGENAGKSIIDWKDDGGNTESVAKYGGFYIARYEAGLPENNDLWSKKDGSTYGWTNNQEPGSLDGNRNTTTMIPVSKKNNAIWNKISQENAITVSKKMYEGSKTVTSNLVDSYAWDTILSWYTKSEIDCTNSTSYGNYLDTEMQLNNALYAIHVFYDGTNSTDDTSKYKSYAKKYTLGSIKIPSRTVVSGNDRILYELSTGSTNYTKRNNIYDLSGNMYEWTTETGNHSVSTNISTNEKVTFTVIRGGSLASKGINCPLSYRDGSANPSGINIGIGFRVVLYINT